MTTLTSLLSKHDTVFLLELIQASVVCEREEQLQTLIQSMRYLIPFDSAVCSLVKTENSELTDQCEIVNVSYPSEWLELYFEKNFHLIDPILIENFTNFGVQYWSDTYKKYDSSKEFIVLAEDFELKGGYSCGVMDRTQNEGSLFSLSGKFQDHPRNRAILGILVPHLHQALSHVARGSRVLPAATLSAREKEVLKWISEGKGSWEISVILGISERTVKFHSATITNKLGASNRVHAVAIALSSGIIAL